ncbi:MAG: iron-containing alcohol dehydrogenase family protein [Gallionella sp.]|nr:iron-containing alcohol dehydrogenase family protein [Gallionella sp.]
MTNASALKTGIRNARNVSRYLFGQGAIADLSAILAERRGSSNASAVFFVDSFFEQHGLPKKLDAVAHNDYVIYVDTADEPTTIQINSLRNQLQEVCKTLPCAIIGIGGGTTMDIAKAVSNLMTNGGNAEDYQGWDLVKLPGIFKIAIPTISGTGAESTRTCVMTNPANGLKLGMNSDFTVYDQIILDPELTNTLPRNQYFYTGMDAYIHCMESMNGSYRNAIGDAYSEQTIRLCRDVFLGDDMMSAENRAKLMVASYLGGCAIATSYVGVVHPFSAGLSVVLGLHHCIANCIVMRAMEPFYPEGYREFHNMAERQGAALPEGICHNLTDEQYDRLYEATVIHQKPLINALGENYKDILTRAKVKEIFCKM